LTWRSTIELSVGSYNIVALDAKGRRTQINPAPILCVSCTSGVGASYAYLVPKHRSGKDLYVEMVGTDGSIIGRFGPAQRR
jgi:hypothetical protein